MQNLIKFLQDISDVKINFGQESSLNVFEKKIKPLFVRNCGYEYKNNDNEFYQDKYSGILLKIVRILSDIDEELSYNCFENKIDYKSFYDEIEFFINDKINEKITKNNISKKIKKLEDDLRNFVLEKYNNHIPFEEKKLIDFLDDKIKSKAELVIIEDGNSNNIKIKEVRYDINKNFFEIKIKDEWIKPKNTSDAIVYSRLCMESILKNRLKNHNMLSKEIVNKMYINLDMMGSLNLTNSIIKNKDILKNKNINTINLVSDISLTIEDIQDIIDNIEVVHSVEKYSQTILSNKYKFLLEPNENNCSIDYSYIEEDIFSLLKELKEKNVDEKKLQDFIGKKLASFKTQEDFKDAIGKLLNTYNNFNKNYYIDVIKNMNTEIIFDKDDILILQINDFETSKKIGSSSWCISRYENNWNNYTKNNNKQYFYFDFNKGSNDKKSMIGITIDNNKITAAHYKNDDYAKNDDYVKEIAKKINELNNKNNNFNLKC